MHVDLIEYTSYFSFTVKAITAQVIYKPNNQNVLEWYKTSKSSEHAVVLLYSNN